MKAKICIYRKKKNVSEQFDTWQLTQSTFFLFAVQTFPSSFLQITDNVDIAGLKNFNDFAGNSGMMQVAPHSNPKCIKLCTIYCYSHSEEREKIYHNEIHVYLSNLGQRIVMKKNQSSKTLWFDGFLMQCERKNIALLSRL
jgi:hypothetical protein